MTSGDALSTPKARGCPICGRGVARRYRPFCSKRCRDVDLGRWLDGDYAVPAEEGAADTLPDDDPAP